MILLMIPFWTSALIRLNGWIIIFRSNGVLDKILMFFNIIDKPLKLLYSFPSVVVGIVYLLIPFMILSIYTSIEKIEYSLIEASKDLGANSLKTFLHIIFPLSMPGILSGIILTFIPSMSLFYVAEVLGGNKVVLIGSIIAEQLIKTRNLPFASAISVILMILTYLVISLYRKLVNKDTIEGII